MKEPTPIRGKHPAGKGRWRLRAVALECAIDLVAGMARPSDEGATFADRDDVLVYADDLYRWLRQDEED